MIWLDDFEALYPELRKQRLEICAQIEAKSDELKNEFPYWINPSMRVSFSGGLLLRLRRGGFHGPLWQPLRSNQVVGARSSQGPIETHRPLLC
jgi:hypothetical protein